MARTGLARALSKRGFCSRRQARELIVTGRVRVNGKVCREPERWVSLEADQIEVDAQRVPEAAKLYLMLNKPRGLITSASDEHGRATVFECFEGAGLPVLAPVGRLDKASEGLLLFTNDTSWAARITDPTSNLEKTYHVQIDCIPDAARLASLRAGLMLQGEFLSAKRVKILRQGARNSWLEVGLTEGRNRHIRRLLGGFDIAVLRLVRVAIGRLQLGNLPKGQFRHLSEAEITMLV